MRMLFTGCVQCGRSTTSVEGLCPTCEGFHPTASPRPQKRQVASRRKVTRTHSRNT